jgi:hypothetical protein
VTSTFAERVRALCVFAFAILAVLSLAFAKPGAGQVGQTDQYRLRSDEGARLMKGAIDMHFHMDADPRCCGTIYDFRTSAEHGLRGLVIKNHNESTATLAYLLRMEIPNFQIFGGIVMNLPNGGENPAAVDYMATQIPGAPGKVVWMPAGDSEIESRLAATTPSKPFVVVSRNGELTPETKAVIALVAKHDLILASGHIAPEEAMLVFAEGGRQGVKHMIATHAMDLSGKMTIDQMKQAVKLGATIEFDFRNVLSEGGRRADAIRELGPEHCLISEFWTKMSQPKEYAGYEGVGEFVEAMHTRGFTDHELDVMFKDNPARLLELPVQ